MSEPSTAPAKDVLFSTTYEPFSREPEYIEANRAFLAGIRVPGGSRLLDVACGTGTMSGLVRDRQAAVDVVGVDLSRESLLLAQEHLGPRALVLVEAGAERLPVRGDSIDVALMGNAIHMVEDEATLLREIARVLRRGGLFAFNTSFYAGTFVPGTERFYHVWVKEALAYIQRAGLGPAPVVRRRGTVRPAFSKPWLSIDEWKQRLADAGFVVGAVYERQVMLNRRSFETIGAYAGFARVLLSGYPPLLASEALQAAAGPALDAVQTTVVPRSWLEMTATKMEVF